jgi:superoxide dismutase, Cu-Zn family
MRNLAAVAVIPLLSGCALIGLGQPAPAPVAPPTPQTVWVVGLNGSAIGQATFLEGADGLLIRLEFSEGALTPGWHGLHLHEVGDCTDAGQNFAAAGAHAGETRQHGLLNPLPSEAGDLPNLFAPVAGPFGAEFFTQRLTLATPAARGRVSLLDADGSALVVHASADDHVIQPAGASGARVACASLPKRP